MPKAVTLIVGFLYGLGLAVFGFMLLGAGHGTSLLLEIASAPLSFLGFVFPLLGPPIMWGVIGWLLGGSSEFQRRIALLLVLTHYLSFALIPLIERYPQGEYLARMFAYDPGFVVFSFSYYLLGQVLIWIPLLKSRDRKV